MIVVTIIFTSGWEETHEIKNKKTIQFTCPDGARIRTIKISDK